MPSPLGEAPGQGKVTRLRAIWLILICAASAGAQGRPPLSDERLRAFIPEGEAIEARADGDLTGDGVADIAVISYGMDNRALTVLRAKNGDFPRLAVREMDAYPQSPATLRIADGVMIVGELSGDTTAIQADYRYRYDRAAGKFRLIGLDARRYSRANAHDRLAISWNLLTGAVVSRTERVHRDAGEAVFGPAVEVRRKRASRPIYLAQTPAPEAMLKLLGE